MSQDVYLDYNATTPCDPRVVAAMIPFFSDIAANSSSTHRAGNNAFKAIQNARNQIAFLIGANSEEIAFTSGATESINLGIRGFLERHSQRTHRRRIVTSPLEHKAVLETYRRMEERGHEIVIVPVDQTGRVKIDEAAKLINENTLLASFQASNNEIGTVQPISELVAICHDKGVVVHCDATQSLGKVPVSVAEWGVDLMSFCAHKMYGPKGIGALYVRGGVRLSALAPIMDGGGQESGVRAGTLNTPGIVGFGEACRIVATELAEESKRVKNLRDRLESKLIALSKSFEVCGSISDRLPNTSNIVFAGIQADVLLANLPNLALSLGSACNSGAIGPSHVLQAIGMLDAEAYSSVRFSLGRFTTDTDIDIALKDIASAVDMLSSKG